MHDDSHKRKQCSTEVSGVVFCCVAMEFLTNIYTSQTMTKATDDNEMALTFMFL